MAFGLKSITGAVGRAFDYLTPGRGSSRVTDWSGWGDRGRGGAPPRPSPNPPPMPNIPSTSAADNAWRNDLMAQIRALNNQIAQQPRLPNFDIMANWRRAQSAAEQAVNPLYEKKLNDFLARQGVLKTEKQSEIGLQREATERELAQTLEESGVTRQRTAEDVLGALQKIGQAEGEFQTDEGGEFDVARRGLAADVAEAGLATSGLGAQELREQITQRNVQSERATGKFQAEREAKELFRTRTFEDLTRGETQAKTLTEAKKKGIQLDLDSYLSELAYNEQQYRFETEQERLSRVSEESGRQAQLGTEQFLAGLPGAGWRPQDIAYARQVYGI